MQESVRLKAEELSSAARKRDRAIVPGSKERLAVWKKFGADIPELRDVAVRLLSAHATSYSAAPVRNWSLWGRIYCAARSALGLERAKALIAICAAEKAKVSASEAFQITLSVVEEDVGSYAGWADGVAAWCWPQTAVNCTILLDL